MKRIAKITGIILFLIFLSISIDRFITYHRTLVTLRGNSMTPTIAQGQEVKVYPYPSDQGPHRGDVIEYSSTNKLVQQFAPSGHLIDRVIGLPGDTISIHNDTVVVTNAQHPKGFNPDTGYVAPTVITSGNVTITLASNQYFVMGDNRLHALDSRAIGPISRQDILGKVSY
jgi:signal peptidase I